MRIKIIGENNCARATRHLLRLAGFAVTEFLPAEAVTDGPLAGYAITIDLAPALFTSDSYQRPDPTTYYPHSSGREEASQTHRDASSPTFPRTAADDLGITRIQFDSVDSALECAVLRHVTQLAAAPVIVDRPGGMVHSDRELRIVAPNSGDVVADEAAAVAIEFGVLRGLLDLTAPAAHRAGHGTGSEKKPGAGNAIGDSLIGAENAFRSRRTRKKWWPFWIVMILGGLGLLRVSHAAAPRTGVEGAVRGYGPRGAPLMRAGLAAFGPGFADPAAQGQFATGQGVKITDGTNYFVVDPCKAQTKLFASISQTANTQLVAGTASKTIYVCSIHVVAATAANVAVVEGTGSVCATGTTGLNGFGGASAATGWNFAANGGIALGNGESAVGAEGNSGDNLCIFSSGSGQVSGGISYVVQ